MNDIEIIVPYQSDDTLSEGLIRLTEAINLIAPEELSHGFLGGEFGYGADYENDTFMMHPFCWCDGDDCKWCNGNAPNFLYKPSGFSVQWYKYIGRSMDVSGKQSDIGAMIADCISSVYKPEAIKALRERQNYNMPELLTNTIVLKAIDEMLDKMAVLHTCDGIALSAYGRLEWLTGFAEWNNLIKAIADRNASAINPDDYQSQSYDDE